MSNRIRSLEEFMRRYPPVEVQRWLTDSSILTLYFSSAHRSGPHLNLYANGWQALRSSHDRNGLHIFRGWIAPWNPFHYLKSPWQHCADYLRLDEARRESGETVSGPRPAVEA